MLVGPMRNDIGTGDMIRVPGAVHDLGSVEYIPSTSARSGQVFQQSKALLARLQLYPRLEVRSGPCVAVLATVLCSYTKRLGTSSKQLNRYPDPRLLTSQ